ncbi:MaoC family dehydratase [Microbacterium immunditiarum]|uniref:Acyl dehydratase n=1 Tax=Microbacterium immunditiarum TaxID=337480 RepID=A0A7Y9GNK0_9MICO|nr:MaoC/PaaZ C-terminal domain-containing protein [Microbacterium immunditiarum]NYE19647.1 acyl dehydratase [Microbacterium immunditiarum]
MTIAETSPVGTELATRTFGPITAQMLVRYSGVSGDLNPIHYDHTFATSAGYRGVFSQGMHHAALMASYVSDLLGPANMRGFLVKFHDQVWLGDVLRCSGKIVGIESGEDADAPLVKIALSMTAQDDRVVLTGEATGLLRDAAVFESDR